MDGANGQTGGKNRNNTFVLTAFISFDLVKYFPTAAMVKTFSPKSL